MFNLTLARLVTTCLTLLSQIIFTSPSRLSAQATGARTGLVVHEWGTFTSVAGKDGITLEWRPLNFESDLPSFVHSVDGGSRRRLQQPSPQPAGSPRPEPRRLIYQTKSATRVSVRMETPILYFYTKEETAVK